MAEKHGLINFRLPICDWRLWDADSAGGGYASREIRAVEIRKLIYVKLLSVPFSCDYRTEAEKQKRGGFGNRLPKNSMIIA